MPKINGRNYKRTAKLKDGSCAKGSKKHRRGDTTGCYKPVAAPKKRKKTGSKKRKK